MDGNDGAHLHKDLFSVDVRLVQNRLMLKDLNFNPTVLWTIHSVAWTALSKKQLDEWELSQRDVAYFRSLPAVAVIVVQIGIEQPAIWTDNITSSALLLMKNI